MELILILGNQLFDPRKWPGQLKAKNNIVFMREDPELCTYYKFHKQKIIFFLAAMRTFRDELMSLGHKVHYEELGSTRLNYEQSLAAYLQKNKIKKIHHFEIEDKFFETRIQSIVDSNQKTAEVIKSPMFLTSRSKFKDYLGKYKKPFMKNFYEQQRKDFKILIDENSKPIGGQWSFDDENRLPLPADVKPPGFLKFAKDPHVLAVQKVCDKFFPEHAGESSDFWLPVQRSQAHDWLDDFFSKKLNLFGPYEDALALHSDFVFHSVLAPFLNTGLLTPDEVVKKAIQFAKKNKVSLASLEGFLRQVIGWREFVRGIYQNFSEVQETKNFWAHHRQLSDVWYKGGSSLPQLERTLEKVFKFSYCHHIERLMVLGNLMLLLEVDPKDAHRWFMEMFIDSSDWVMGPNVYGMALFSDGGIFATKPYICGSNYWRKMSKEKAGDWCDGMDGLYWKFIDNHRDFFSKNPRLSMMVRSLDKMDAERKKLIFKAAKKLQDELTVSS
ncbi:MAG: cryptochrome/photolyase family protein [Pseudobdellovibrionaceae bacterium]